MPRIRSTATKTCGACNAPISDKAFNSCKTTSCGNSFHLLCTPAIPPDQRSSWACPECQCKKRRPGDNSSTPVKGVTGSEATSDSTPGEVLAEFPANPMSTLIELTTEFRLLREELTAMKTEFSSAISSLSGCHERLDKYESQLQSVDKRLTTLENQHQNALVLENTIKSLEDQLHHQAQQSLRNDIEIIGISESPGENPVNLVLVTAIKIGMSLTDEDIDFSTRTGPIYPKDPENNAQRPRPLVVRFSRRAKRDEFLDKARSRKISGATEITTSGSQFKIYVNERLTRENRKLFRDCRAFANLTFRMLFAIPKTKFKVVDIKPSCSLKKPSLFRYQERIFFGDATSCTPSGLAKIKSAYDFTEKFLKMPYLAGDHITLADISCVATISSLKYLMPIDKAIYPNLTDWLERMSQEEFYKRGNLKGEVEFKELLQTYLAR